MVATAEWIWSYAHAAQSEAGSSRLQKLLADGWEPFAATSGNVGVTIHLRKQVLHEPQTTRRRSR